jgi:hypothetical protein
MPVLATFGGTSLRNFGLTSGTTSSAAVLGDFESISTVTVGAGGQSSIEFTSIPQTYKHLQIRGIARAANAADFNDMRVRFNSDSGSNYSAHQLFGDGGSAQTNSEANETNMYFIYSTAASSGASIFASGIMDIVDYTDTNKYKTQRSLHGSDRNGSGYSILRSGHWRSFSAITSITLFYPAGPSNFVQYSSFALYGLN